MITHKGTKTIQTARLLLRRFTVEDAQAMFDNWASDERVTRFLTWDPHTSVEETKEILSAWCAAYENPDSYHWAMEYDGTVIGGISIVRFYDKRECADLGYCMGYDYWNKGLMTEAAKAVIDFLFTEVGVNRLEISHAVKNPASGKVAQKCGFTYEGTKREAFKTSAGEFLDIAYHSLLRREWASGRKI